MQRADLKLTDQQIIDHIKQGWDFNIIKISYINTGSIFAFCLIKQDREKVFLKISYKRHDNFVQF